MPSLSKWRRQLRPTLNSNPPAIISSVNDKLIVRRRYASAASAARPAATLGAVGSPRTRSDVNLVFCHS